jgi:hypothetical protein
MKFYVLRLVDRLPNAVRQTNQPKHIKPFLLHNISCVPQTTHSQQAMTKVKYVLVPDVK